MPELLQMQSVAHSTRQRGLPSEIAETGKSADKPASVPARNVHASALGFLVSKSNAGTRGRTAAQIAVVRQLQCTHGNHAVQRLLHNRATGLPVALETAQHKHKNETDAAYAKLDAADAGHAAPPPPPGGPTRPKETLHVALDQGFPTPAPLPIAATELSAEATGRPAPGAVRGPVSAPMPPRAKAAASPLNAKAGEQAQLIQADSARSEAQIVKIAVANRQRVSGFFGGLRGRFSAFFAQSSAGVQQFIAGKQSEISAAAAGIVKSAQAAVANATNAAEANANKVRETINSTVQSVTASLQAKVQSVTDQIAGVVNRVPFPDLPGVAQVRAAATSILRGAAGAVTSGLSQVRALISSALTAGMTLVRSMLAVLHQAADAVISQAGNAVQRILQTIFQTLSRTAGLIITALRGAFNNTILPMVNNLEGKIQQAIGQSQQQAISAIRTNRDEHLHALSPQGQSKGDAGAASPAGGPAGGGVAQDAADNNKNIVQTFTERSSGIIESIIQRVTTAGSQIVDHISRAVAQANQLIGEKVREVAQGLGRIVDAVSGFIQSAVQALTGALSNVIGYVRALIENPIDQLLRFGAGVVSRITDFISGMVRNLVNAITGSASSPETGQFVPAPALAPAPAFLAPAVPVVVAIVTAIVLALGGSVTLIGGTIMIIIGGSVFFVSETVVVVVAAVVAFLLLLLLIYILYKILTKTKPKPKPPERIISETVQPSPGARTRTTIGVGEEVDLTYTGGSTTWSTTGGSLSALTGPAVQLTAPDTAKSITVTAGSATLSFTVIAPSGVFMERHGAMQHTVNQPDSGVRMRPFLLPDSVNFYRVIYHEMDVPFVATPGVYSCNPGKGGHCGAGGGGAPCPDLPVTNNVVSGQGTQTVNDDCAYSSHCGTPPPFKQGSVLGSIPHEYKVGSGSFHPFPPVLQKHSLAADGVTLTTEKDHAKGTIQVPDKSSSNGC